MSDLDELRQRINNALKQGTSVNTGLRLIKAVQNYHVIKILKSGGVLSAEDILLQSNDDLYVSVAAKDNAKHPQFKNSIYATVTKAKQTSERQTVNIIYGEVSIVMKESVLRRPNTTYTYFDSLDDRNAGNHIELYKGEFLTESEIVKAYNEYYSNYIEVQIRSKVSLAEIEKIVYHNEPPIEEEKELANKLNVPLEYKGVIVAGNIPGQNPTIPDPPVLPVPVVVSPINNPPVLPDYPDYPVLLPAEPSTPPALKPADPMPAEIPNFTRFKTIDEACKWLEAGKDLEIDFEPKFAPATLKFCAEDGRAGLWHNGTRYTNFF